MAHRHPTEGLAPGAPIAPTGRRIGCCIGSSGSSWAGLTIWALLNITDALSGDTQPKYVLSIVIGLLVAPLWPWVAGILFARRAKSRRDDQIQAEVERQLAEERSRSNLG